MLLPTTAISTSNDALCFGFHGIYFINKNFQQKVKIMRSVEDMKESFKLVILLQRFFHVKNIKFAESFSTLRIIEDTREQRTRIVKQKKKVFSSFLRAFVL